MRKTSKYVIMLLVICCMIALFIFIKSKLPNDKYNCMVYSSTEEIMQNFEANKSNYEEFISYFEGSEYNRELWYRIYEKCDHFVVWSPYPHNGKNSIKGVIDDNGQAKLEDIFSKTGLYYITRKYGYYGFSYSGHEEGVTFYYIINKDTESREYKDTKNYLCQDDYSIINDNWLYKINEY